MNKYLEKIAEQGFVKEALNAQKARQLAQEAGVIVDPQSNWKYALRNLRDSWGGLLEGRERREALTRLAGGVDPLRERQKLMSIQRRGRDVDEAQRVTNIKGDQYNMLVRGSGHMGERDVYADTIDLGDRIQDIERFGNQVIRLRGNAHAFQENIGNKHGARVAHVHPGTNLLSSPRVTSDLKDFAEGSLNPTLSDLALRKATFSPETRQVSPSAFFPSAIASRQMGKAERRRLVADDADFKEISDLVRRPQESFDYEKFTDLVGKIKSKTETLPPRQRLMRESPGAQADNTMFSQITNNAVNPIYAGGNHVAGFHKVITDPKTSTYLGQRSYFLDLSPRKMKSQ